jgi:hypothetical protein
VRELWHSTTDLLTVRYFQLIDLATDDLLRLNAKDDRRMHSGLSVDQLKDAKLVLDTYRTRLEEATNAVMKTPLARI